MRGAAPIVLLSLLAGCGDPETGATRSPSTEHARPEGMAPDDGGRARRMRAVERANEAVAKHQAGLTWHEHEGLVVKAVVERGRCTKGLLAKLVATVKRAGIDLRTEGFVKIECALEPASLDL
jgi:hypothetical protein